MYLSDKSRKRQDCNVWVLVLALWFEMQCNILISYKHRHTQIHIWYIRKKNNNCENFKDIRLFSVDIFFFFSASLCICVATSLGIESSMKKTKVNVCDNKHVWKYYKDMSLKIVDIYLYICLSIVTWVACVLQSKHFSCLIIIFKL